MTISIPTFKGEMPRVASQLLPTEVAEYAKNCHYDSGNLEALPRRTGIAAILKPVPLAIYLYAGEHWFSWGSEVNAISSPVAQDQYDRVYFSGTPAGPQVTSNLIATGVGTMPDASYRLGVPAPAKPTAAVVDGGDDDDIATDEDRAYVYTYVTEYGEEGPPSLPTDIVTLDDPQQDSVNLTLPTLASNIYNITHKRIYRTATGGNSTEFYFVAEIPVAQTSYNDTLATTGLGAELTTYDFDPPPHQFYGLVKGANGICAGFSGNEFMPSEPYLPYAYPIPYRRSLEHDIVAIAPTETGFVVATEGHPYLIQGIHPNAMTERKLPINQACVSSRSMVDMGNAVFYASPDGIVAISEGSAGVITEGLFTKREWDEFQPSSIHAYRSEDRYIAFYDNGSEQAGFIFEPRLGTITRLGFYASAGYNDLETDTLYLAIGGLLYSYGTGVTLETYTWRSKEFFVPDMAYQAVKVWTPDPADVGLKITVDGVTLLDIASLPAEAFKIPAGRGTRWQVEFTGTGTIERFSMGASMGELP